MISYAIENYRIKGNKKNPAKTGFLVIFSGY